MYTLPFIKPKYFHVGLTLLQRVVVIDSKKWGASAFAAGRAFFFAVSGTKSASFLSIGRRLHDTFHANWIWAINGAYGLWQIFACAVTSAFSFFPQNMQTHSGMVCAWVCSGFMLLLVLVCNSTLKTSPLIQKQTGHCSEATLVCKQQRSIWPVTNLCLCCYECIQFLLAKYANTLWNGMCMGMFWLHVTISASL